MMKRALLRFALVATLSSTGCTIAATTLGALMDHSEPKPNGETKRDTGMSATMKGFLIGAAVDLTAFAVLATAMDSGGTPCLGTCGPND